MSAYRTLVDWIEEHRAIGIDLVRMYLGVGLFVRGILFIAESRGISALVDLSQFSVASAALAHYVTFAHLVGGLMLAAGLLTRLAALTQIPILIGAVFLVHLQEGLLSPNQSLEFSALVLFLLVVTFVFGAGPWSADRYVFEQEPALQEQEPEMWWRDEAFEDRSAVPGDGAERVPQAAGGTEVAARSPAEAATKQAAAEKAEVTTCSCGNDLSHPRVTAEPRYGWSSGFFFMLGISAPVKEVVFRCEKCGTVMKRTRDPDILRQYRWHTS
jgi:uncharacterized membrane protein YphA (DoxX/SURF4 family)